MKPSSATHPFSPRRASERFIAWLAACLLWLAFAPTFSRSHAANASETELKNHIAILLAQPRFDSSHWGVKMISLKTGKALFEHNASRFFVPASNTKTFTCALALQRLGPDHRIATSLYANQPPNSKGILKGDLTLYGRGDPSFSDEAAPESNRGLDRIIQAMKSAGIQVIEGDLVLDTTYFWGRVSGTGWPMDDLPYSFSAPVDAFNYRDNTVEMVIAPGAKVGDPARVEPLPPSAGLLLQSAVTTGPTNSAAELQLHLSPSTHRLNLWGSIPVGQAPMTNEISVMDPTSYFGAALLEQMQKSGIRLKGRLRTTRWDDPQSSPPSSSTTRRVELGHVYSPPLSELVKGTMKPSNNQHAQLLFLQVGAQEPDLSRSPSERAATAMREFLREAKLPELLPQMEEGSGLSRRHLVSPDHMVTLLRYLGLRTDSAAQALMDAFPVAGVDGTLRHRFRGTPLEGKMRAKTGTLDGIHSLCGYGTTAGGEPVAFALFLNYYFPTEGEGGARKDLDELALLLLSWP